MPSLVNCQPVLLRASAPAEDSALNPDNAIEPPFVLTDENGFYRVERPTGQQVDGTGLGLAITKRIVELHEGDIEVDSEPERGTPFSIVLAAAASFER